MTNDTELKYEIEQKLNERTEYETLLVGGYRQEMKLKHRGKLELILMRMAIDKEIERRNTRRPVN